ncbi:MAG: hypothetical protein HOP14_12395, partial [Acidobacteria bacterium]|nr:hypothetical protein [Acidobacteriota bacterium]
MTESLKGFGRAVAPLALLLALLIGQGVAFAQQAGQPGQAAEAAERVPGGEVNLVLPPLDQVLVGGYNGRTLLMGGLFVALL